MTDILEKQYQGFLNTSQLFKDEKILGAKPFHTDEKVNYSSILKYAEVLSKHKYLGKRAEIFLLAYLATSERYTDIIHSFQINSEEKTIGELDFICFDQLKQRWLHIELIYKLYVFTGKHQFNDFTFWIGPNLKDRLDFKVDKLRSHQLPLGQHADIKNEINTNNIESYCCFKAKLFLENKAQSLVSSTINSECVSGTYFNFEKFMSLKYQKSLFHVPEKMNWTCLPETNAHWYDHEKATNQIKIKLKEKRAQLIREKTESGQYLEYFVVWW